MRLYAAASRQIDKYPSRVADHPQWLERLDPIVYSQWHEQAPLTQEQYLSYEKKGFLVIEDFFSQEEVNTWRKELRRLQQLYKTTPADEVIREPGSEDVRSIFAVHELSEVYAELSKHSRLRAITDYLLGSPTYIHQSRINDKPGFKGKEFYWHSDFETWHVEDGMPTMHALSCSIALEDNYTYNGALLLVPGSHRHFITCVGRTPDDHYKQSLRKQEYGVPDEESLRRLIEAGGIETALGKAGSITLFDCNTMHGSSSNISPYSRSNVFMVFNSQNNRLVAPYSGQDPRPSYIATR